MNARVIVVAMMCLASGWALVRQAGAQGAGDRMPIQPPPPAIDPELERALATGPKGSVAIRAVQGTKGGPELGALEYELQLIHRNQAVRVVSGKLNENGMAIVQDLPVALPVRPLVRIKYSDATYQDVGEQLDQSHTSASVNVTVYEITSERPAWRVTQRTLAVATIPGQFDVVETIEVVNPLERTWMGEPADAQGRRATTSFMLVPGAKDVQLESGFHGWCCTSVQDNLLTVQMPLMPGKAAYRFSYRVDWTGSAPADVSVSAPVACDEMLVLIPEEGVRAESTLLKEGVTRVIGGTRVRAFACSSLKAGTTAGLQVSTAQTPAPPTAMAAPKPGEMTRVARAERSWWSGGTAPVVVALSVGGVILGGAVLLVVLRSPARNKAKGKA